MSEVLQKLKADAELSDDDLRRLLLDAVGNVEWDRIVSTSDHYFVVQRLVTEILMLRNQKKKVRLTLDYDEEDGMIPAPHNAVTEEGHKEFVLSPGEYKSIVWYDEETETRVECKVTMMGIEVE